MAELPAADVFGTRLESTGAGSETVKVEEDEVPPPGAGLKTVTSPEPGMTRSPAVMAAVKVLLLTNAVLQLAPFH
jgi:hypothetical protein